MQAYAEPRLTHAEGRAQWLALLEQVQRRRLLAPALAPTLAKLALLAALLAASLWLTWSAASWTTLGAGCAALALLLAQFAFIGHDAGHGSISRSASLNRALGQASMTLVTGLAFDEWSARHRLHHRYCQDEARDPDMAVDLVVSLTAGSRERKGTLGRWLTRHQAIHIWLLSLLFGHSQRHLSQAAVLVSPRRNRLDAALLLAHYALWFGVPCVALDVSPGRALLAYLLPLTLLGPYLAAIFWVNHVGMPLVRDIERFSFFEHQVLTSRTISSPRAVDWLFGGLNFQIEHHLFPQVPARRLAAAQEIVRGHFDRVGIDYPGVSWRGAVCAIASHLRRVGRAA